jgi:hypothetical protein
MLKRFLQLAVILGSLPAFAQTPTAQVSNAVSICTESQACVITAISDPNARFQFGAGNTWCQAFSTPKLPITVTSTSPVCSYNPAPGVDKTLAGQQRNTTYFVTYSLGGKTQPVKTIPGLLSVPTIVASYNCMINVYSDGTFQSSNCSAVTK